MIISWVEVGVSRLADNNDDDGALLIVRALWLVSIILGWYVQYIEMDVSACCCPASCCYVLLQLAWWGWWELPFGTFAFVVAMLSLPPAQPTAEKNCLGRGGSFGYDK